MEDYRVFTVGELTEKIQDLLEENFDFVSVEGEISNFRSPVSGHFYMVLKDDAAQIRAVMFRMQARYLKFLPEDGMKVVARGRIGVYAPRGEYQIILDYLEPLGVGALALAFEQLKKKLAAQGIFDREIKKPLPFLPRRVAVITSPTGAAIQDFLKVIRRRFANLEITVVPVRVQGEAAAKEIAEALETVNSMLKADVIVLTRGGGSLEDLWAFNQERVALAIRNSRIPVVSAVGHEVDLTISDLAADLRAPTPSAAGELLVVEKESLVTRLGELGNRLVSEIGSFIRDLSQDLDVAKKGLKDPRKRLADAWLRLDEEHARIIRIMESLTRDLQRRLRREGRALLLRSPAHIIASLREKLAVRERALAGCVQRRLENRGADLSLLDRRMTDLSPLSILKRGYSITRKLPEKIVLKEATGVKSGDRVEVLLGEGQLECRVEEVE